MEMARVTDDSHSKFEVRKSTVKVTRQKMCHAISEWMSIQTTTWTANLPEPQSTRSSFGGSYCNKY